MPAFVVDLLFLLAAVTAVGGGLFAITRRNAVYAVLGLILVFVCIAGVFALLDSVFLAVGQLMVYAGAILMLFLFVVMLFDLGRGQAPDREVDKEKDPLFDIRALIITVLLGLFLIIPVLMAGDQWERFPENTLENRRDIISEQTIPLEIAEDVPDENNLRYEYGTPTRVGYDMFDRYLVAFELVALILLAGIVGAVVLAKRRHRVLEDEERAEEDELGIDGDGDGDEAADATASGAAESEDRTS